MRQNGLGYAQHSEQINLELLTEILHTKLFDDRHVPDSGIVDEHVDAIALFQNKLDTNLHRSTVGYIHLQRADRKMFFVRQAVQFFALYSRAPSSADKITMTREQQRRSFTKSIRSTGDEYRAFSLGHCGTI